MFVLYAHEVCLENAYENIAMKIYVLITRNPIKDHEYVVNVKVCCVLRFSTLYLSLLVKTGTPLQKTERKTNRNHILKIFMKRKASGEYLKY